MYFEKYPPSTTWFFYYLWFTSLDCFNKLLSFLFQSFSLDLLLGFSPCPWYSALALPYTGVWISLIYFPQYLICFFRGLMIIQFWETFSLRPQFRHDIPSHSPYTHLKMYLDLLIPSCMSLNLSFTDPSFHVSIQHAKEVAQICLVVP